MKKTILLVIGIIVAALALVTPSQDQFGRIIYSGPHKRISVRIVNSELMRTNVTQVDSAAHITTLIIG